MKRLIAILLSSVSICQATAPTNSAYTNSIMTDSIAGETTGSVNWNSGDLVVVLGITEDNTLTFTGTPATTGTGLTFAAISGFPTNTGSNTKAYAWSATAAATSNGTITITGSGSAYHGLAVWVFSGHGGIGNSTPFAGDTTDPYGGSLIRSGNNSYVVGIYGDWAAVSDATSDPSPSTNATERIGDTAGFVSGRYVAYVYDWGDQGAAGTTTYGNTGITGAKITGAVVEILGTESAATPTCGPPFCGIIGQ